MIDVKFHWSKASWIWSILTETQRSMDTLESVKHSLTTIVAFFSLEFVVSCWPLTRTKNCAVLIRNINTIALIFSHKSDPKGPKYELPERKLYELCFKGTQRIYFCILCSWKSLVQNSKLNLVRSYEKFGLCETWNLNWIFPSTHYENVSVSLNKIFSLVLK